MQRKDEERIYTVTEEEYDAEIASGLTDEEVLKPGRYKLRHNPWAEKLRKAGKVTVTVYRVDEIVEEFWIQTGRPRRRGDLDTDKGCKNIQ